jgi:hypothetical protein
VALAAWGGTTPGLPGLAAVLGLKEPIERVYGGELDAEIYFRHSPVAVAALITAPASIVSSTADMMVPLDQVSREHVRRPAAGVMPPGYSSAPEDLSESRHVSTTLADALQGADVRFEVVPVPEGVPRLSPEIQPGDYVAVPIPWTDAQWTVAVVDEGAPDPGTGHVKYAIRIPRDPAVLERLLARPSASQLTAAKLRQLLQRLDGQEWLYPGVRHLDDPDAERADVQKGLAAFRSLPGGEERFREVLPAVDPDLRALAESELPLAAGA